MVEKILLFLKNQLEAYLKKRSGSEGKISLRNITDADGKVLVEDLFLTLVNIEEESVLKNQPHFKETSRGTIAKVNPEVMVNLYLLFSANFGDAEFNYRESLKFISYVMSFFQSRRVFTPNNSPGLDGIVERITIELVSMSFEQQNHLWSMFSTSYMPSVMYKLKVIAIQEGEIKMDAPPITEASLKV